MSKWDSDNGIDSDASDSKKRKKLIEKEETATDNHERRQGRLLRTRDNVHIPLLHGCRSVYEYESLNFIDEGTYGMVFKGKCLKTNKIYALKRVKLGTTETSKNENKLGFPITALREINILLSLSHPNIVNVREMVVGSAMNQVFMVMDFSENDIKSCIELSKPNLPFSTGEVKCLMHQLLSGVDHLHSKWYLHRDLKTSNLLYSNRGVLTICDFGMARKYGNPPEIYTFECVTLWYRAPEVLLGSRLYSTPLDMWSVGCIFAELCLGSPLFCGSGEIDQINIIFRILGAPSEEKWPGFSELPNAKSINWRSSSTGRLRETVTANKFSSKLQLNNSGYDLLAKLLEMDPTKRMSASDALQHIWFTEDPKPTQYHMMPMFRDKHESSTPDNATHC